LPATARIGHSDVAFTMRQYVQTDLEVHRQVATALAELIIGGTRVACDLARVRVTSQVASRRSAYLRFSIGMWASAASIASSAAQSTWGATPRPSQLVPVTESVQYPNGSSPVTVAASRISVT
jgi:hypothetical protein